MNPEWERFFRAAWNDAIAIRLEQVEPDAGVQSPWLLDDGNELASNMGSL